MIDVSKFKPSLTQQLSGLEAKIRETETELLKLKEGYLKVSGALELLEIALKEQEENDSLDEEAAVAEVFPD
jgi:hypothetical protein